MKTVLFILWLTLGTHAMSAHAGYEEGAIAFKDKAYTIAYREFLAPAKQGDSRAQNALGVLYENGWGVHKDVRTAFEWYVLAANQGSAMAQFNLAGMYIEGKGVDLNLQEAFRLYRLSAEQGVAGAQRYLGYFYATGKGVAEDQKEAVRWYQLAADQDDAEAQYRLGLQYHQGKGVPRNLEQATIWYRRAINRGNHDARNWLMVAEQQLETQTNRSSSGDSERSATQDGAGAPPGAPIKFCNCWGGNPPAGLPEPICASGWTRILFCPGPPCPNGTPQPYSFVCR